MQISDFSFELPEHLIAQYPQPSRSASRLMVLDGATNTLEHRQFVELPRLLRAGDLLVLNDTRVIPARLHGVKASGGRVEVMFERVLADQLVLARIRASKSPKPGSEILLCRSAASTSAFAADPASDKPVGGPTVVATVVKRDGEFFVLQFAKGLDPIRLLEQQGSVPLPPYIHRAAEPADTERYQTIYGTQPGAVAAPTAGLHFDEAVLHALSACDIRTTTVTLHVGAGTFQPVRATDIARHVMHAEHVSVSAETVDTVAATRERGGRIIAVGTTSVRCLETASRSGKLGPYTGDTRIFIKPGMPFRVVDGMITNFHLPQSTLLMLVSAFAGRENIIAAYLDAIRLGYRFYSYGDAMLLWPDRRSWTASAATGSIPAAPEKQFSQDSDSE